MEKIIVFTDGGGFKNEDESSGYDSSSAFRIFKSFSDGRLEFLTEKTKITQGGTNNFGEIHAIRMGLQEAKKVISALKTDKSIQVEVYTDSKLCIQSLTQWIWGWMKNRRDGVLYRINGEKVKNQEEILGAFKLMKELKNKKATIRFFHVNSHKAKKNIEKDHKNFQKKNDCEITLDFYKFIYAQNDLCDKMVTESYNKFQRRKKDV